MKTNSFFNILLLIFMPLFLNAQALNSHFILSNNEVEMDSFSGITAESNFQLGSSSINAGMFGDYLFSDRFEAENKEKFTNSKADRTRLSAINAYTLNYFHRGEKKSWQISIDYNSASYASTSAPVSKLLLFGNKQYAGTEVYSKNNFASVFNYSNLSFSKTAIKNDKLFVRWQLGLTALYGLTYFSADEIRINTESSGEYIDIGLNNGSFREASAGLDGVGINAGLTVIKGFGNHQLRFAVQQVSPVMLFDKKYYLVDTSFRFEGIELNSSNITNINFSELSDSLENQLLYQHFEDRSWFVLPINMAISYLYSINDKSGLELKLENRAFGNYGATISAIYQYNHKNRLLLRTILGYGNFRGLYLSEETECRLSEDWNLKVGLFGLNSLVSPRQFSFYGFSFGIGKAL